MFKFHFTPFMIITGMILKTVFLYFFNYKNFKNILFANFLQDKLRKYYFPKILPFCHQQYINSNVTNYKKTKLKIKLSLLFLEILKSKLNYSRIPCRPLLFHSSLTDTILKPISITSIVNLLKVVHKSFIYLHPE